MTPPPQTTAPVPPAPLSLTAWWMQNGPYILIFIALVVLAYVRFGPDWMWTVAKTAIGLGFVVFIHELGHFLAAKWCDVHVLTFSVGFGPALPGCSFTRGETTYKIAILPLGGYVNMVGEGPEADEEEDYPRSFKNKTVSQRMLIISAGVIMNVLFGALCFVLVYRYQGVDRPPAVIWRTEPGSQAWINAVQPGWRVTQMDDTKDPWFDQMRVKVALSQEGESIDFTFVDRDGDIHQRSMEPHADANSMVPVIGVDRPIRLQLLPERYRREFHEPVTINSAAAAARVLNLGKDDVVVAADDPKTGKLTPLPTGPKAWRELSNRMMKIGKEPFTIEVRRGGSKDTEKIVVPAEGFEFGDTVIGTTNPATPGLPFNVIPLPPLPAPLNQTSPKKPIADPFEFRRRMAELAGRPAVIQVLREGAGDSEPVNILVPPAFHVTFGMTMKMGKVAAIRQDSPAADSGLNVGDVIKGASLVYEDQPPIVLDQKALDPVRLPYELDRRIRADKKKQIDKWKVILTVSRLKDHNTQSELVLKPMRWDAQYALGEEVPVGAAAPMAIPQLGIAYWVESTVVKVDADSPASAAGVKAGDEIQEISYRERSRKDDEVSWSGWYKMASKRGKGQEVYDQWAHFFWMLQRIDYAEVRLRVKRVENGKSVVLELPPRESSDNRGMVAEIDPTWPVPERGLLMISDTRRQKAQSMLEALTFGMERTVGFIKQIYLNLYSLFSGRISTKSVGGPIEIAAQAFTFAGEDLATFALFLGMISINLAVVNFLPIPVLDGGHMVFLIYEKLRGRPPSEAVRVGAAYLGLAIILLLMLFVFYLDIKRRFLQQL